MKAIKIMLLAVVAFCIASCGGKKNSEREEIVLTPETIHIKGDLGDYFEVVDKEYTVTDGWGDMVSIEVKRTDEDFDFDLKGVAPYGTFGQGVTSHVGFGIEILDENGNVIEKASATASGLSGMYSSNDMEEAIKLKTGETSTVRWSFHFNSDKKPTSFRLTSAYEEVEESDYNSSSSDDDDDIWSDDYESESTVSNQELEAAKAAVELAKQSVELLKSTGASKTEIMQAQAAVKIAEAELKAIEKLSR